MLTEFEAFTAAARVASPDQLTAATEWTAREVVAHVVAGAAEITAHVEAYLVGGVEAVPMTRPFDEREAPYRALRYVELLGELECNGAALDGALRAALSTAPEAVIPWTGRLMPVGAFVPHIRTEAALHRWDLAGDDDVSRTLLSQADLTAHSVHALGRPLLATGRASAVYADGTTHVLRSPGRPDIVIDRDGIRFGSDSGNEHDAPVVLEGDADARLLVLWGRTPNPPGRLRAPGGAAALADLRSVLAGY